MTPADHDSTPAPAADDAANAREYRLIQAQLRRGGLTLAMPLPLEQAYCRYHDNQAAASLRSAIGWAFALYLLLGGAVLLVLRPSEMSIWPLTNLVFLVLIAIGWLISRRPWMKRYYQLALPALASCATFYAVIHPSLIPDPSVQALVHQGTVYAVVLIYLGLNLRFRYAVIAGTVIGLFAYPLIYFLQLPLDWDTSIVTYIGAGGLGALLCYRDEQRKRKLFLQARLLELDNERIHQLAEELERLSFLDGLTGLANRRYFDRTFERAWRTGMREQKPLSVVMLDVDFFKRYNDFYGHQQGDFCLQEIARALSFVSARPQDLVARYGGEEIVLLFAQTDNLAARHLAERIMNKVRSLQLPHETSDCAEVVTVSAGIATAVPAPDISREQLLQSADEALYKAKHQGRNRWFSDDKLL